MDESLVQYKEKVQMPVAEVLVAARAELDGHLKLADGKVGAGLKKLEQAANMERRIFIPSRRITRGLFSKRWTGGAEEWALASGGVGVPAGARSISRQFSVANWVAGGAGAGA